MKTTVETKCPVCTNNIHVCVDTDNTSNSASATGSIADSSSGADTPILSFEMGVIFAAAIVARDFDNPTIAAEIMRAASLENADCSQEDEMEKIGLRKINLERGIQLQGLEQ